MAGRAIARYFKTSPCYGRVAVLRLARDREAVGLSDTEALQFSRSQGVQPDRLILVRVEELGPFIVLYPSPVLWAGGTEALIRVRVLDVKTAALEADITAHLKNGGAFVLRGTGSLEEDLEAALTAVFGLPNRSLP